jgi:hypothetical protein
MMGGSASTTNHNQTATQNKRPHKNTNAYTAPKKMKNKAAAFFFN